MASRSRAAIGNGRATGLPSNQSTSSASYSRVPSGRTASTSSTVVATPASSKMDCSTSSAGNVSKEAVNGGAGATSSTAVGPVEANISVYVRVRKRNDQEIASKSPSVLLPAHEQVSTSLVLLVPPPASASYGASQITAPETTTEEYAFDRVFNPVCTQERVFEEVVRPTINEVMSGINCAIFAYGQSGTGKTYTMLGPPLKRGEKYLTPLLVPQFEAGILPRTLSHLFNHLSQLDPAEMEWSIKATFVEIYNEQVRDLFSDQPPVPGGLVVYEDASSKSTNGPPTFNIKGVQETVLLDLEGSLKTLAEGVKRRETGETGMNKESSRSHSIYSIILTMIPRNGRSKTSKFNLVDLAGSESIGRSDATGNQAREAGLINKSLLALGKIMTKLSDRKTKNDSITYRESKLTSILSSSLGGSTRTRIIATISPAEISLSETRSTLKYATAAKGIVNKVQGSGLGPNRDILIKTLESQIAKLQGDLNATYLQNGVSLSNKTYEDLKERERQNEQMISDVTNAKIELQNKLDDSQRQYLDAVGSIREKENQLRMLQEAVAMLKAEAESDEKERMQLEHKIDRKEEVAISNTLAIQSHLSSTNQEVKSLVANTKSFTAEQQIIHSNLQTAIYPVQSTILPELTNALAAAGATLTAFTSSSAAVQAVSSAAWESAKTGYETSEMLEGAVRSSVEQLEEKCKAEFGGMGSAFKGHEGNLKQLASSSSSWPKLNKNNFKVLAQDNKFREAEISQLSSSTDTVRMEEAARNLAQNNRILSLLQGQVSNFETELADIQDQRCLLDAREARLKDGYSALKEQMEELQRSNEEGAAQLTQFMSLVGRTTQALIDRDSVTGERVRKWEEATAEAESNAMAIQTALVTDHNLTMARAQAINTAVQVTASNMRQDLSEMGANRAKASAFASASKKETEQTVNEMESSVTTGVDSIKKLVNSTSKSLKLVHENVGSTITSSASNVSGHSEFINSTSAQLQQSSNAFSKSGVKIDLPTGATPPRRTIATSLPLPPTNEDDDNDEMELSTTPTSEVPQMSRSMLLATSASSTSNAVAASSPVLHLPTSKSKTVSRTATNENLPLFAIEASSKAAGRKRKNSDSSAPPHKASRSGDAAAALGDAKSNIPNTGGRSVSSSKRRAA